MDKNSSITDDTLMKLHVHNHTLVIYILYKFQKYHPLVTKLWLRTEKIIEI